MPAWIEEIRERLNAATSGPWKASYPIGKSKASISQVKEDRDGWSNHICNVYKQDAEFIAHSPEDIAKLIQAVEVSEKALKELEWSGTHRYLTNEPICPSCGSTRWEEHEPECLIAPALAQLQSGEFPKEDA